MVVDAFEATIRLTNGGYCFERGMNCTITHSLVHKTVSLPHSPNRSSFSRKHVRFKESVHVRNK